MSAKYPTIEQLALALKRGELSLYQHVDACVTHLEHLDAELCSFLPEPGRRERLHREAEALLRRYPDPKSRPPLFGILIGVKDLFNVDGLPTRAGSQLPPEAFSGAEAESVSLLRRAGALVLGKTVSTEFAYFSPGPTRNPKALGNSPGGSSSGSAAAVSAGLVPLALGTQTIASITRPASYCGVYGYKPSYGLISTAGVFPFSQAADHVGFICSTLADILYTAQLFTLLTPRTQAQKPRLGIPVGSYLEQADSATGAIFAATLERLEAAGFTLVRNDLFGDIEALNTAHRRLIAGEFYRNHKALFSRYGELYSPHSRELYAFGETVSPSEQAILIQEQLALREHITETSHRLGIDLWISPSTTSPAPLGLHSTGSPLMSLPWTNAGVPTLSLPYGSYPEGLPFGLQVSGLYGKDGELLRAARICAARLMG